MKYTHFEYKPSEKMKKSAKGRFVFWWCFAVIWLALRLTVIPLGEDESVAWVIGWNLVYFGLVCPYLGYRWESRTERKAQRAQFKQD